MTAMTLPALDPATVLDDAIAALKVPGGPLPLGDIDRALTVSPHDPRLWHIKGLIHREQEQRELAIPALRRAVELAPSEPLIAHGLARTLLEAGLPAVEEFVRAVRLSRSNPEVITGLVSALVAEGRTAEAIDGLEQALHRSPLWVEGHVLISSLRYAEGERLGFARSFDAVLAIHPNSFDLRRDQLITLVHAEQWDEVLARIDEGRRLFGDLPLFVAHEATVRAETGEVQAADALFAQLAPMKDANLEIRRVRHLLRSGRPQEASQVLDEWLPTLDDGFVPYAAAAWRQTGDPRLAWLEGDARFVGVYDIRDRLPPLDQLAGLLRNLHTTRSQPLAQSVRGGTQTDGHLFQRIEPEIIQLREAVRAAVAEHAAQLPPSDPAHPLLRSRPQQIQFTGAWSVRLAGGGSHANHVHPMGWLSSALYVVLPPDLGLEHAGWLTLGEPQAQLMLDLPPTRMIEPKPGRLVLFPSWMWHGTRPFGEGERMTVAFDVARGVRPPG
jgi:tetratricopeptide (TPR) repeat protein